MFATMTHGTEVFVGACILVLFWLLYMATFKTEEFKVLLKLDEELKQKRHERMKDVTKGGMTVVGWIVKRVMKK